MNFKARENKQLMINKHLLKEWQLTVEHLSED